jgi:hypothetical protein
MNVMTLPAFFDGVALRRTFFELYHQCSSAEQFAGFVFYGTMYKEAAAWNILFQPPLLLRLLCRCFAAAFPV